MHTPSGCKEPLTVEKSQTDFHNAILRQPTTPCSPKLTDQKARGPHPAYLFWKLQSRLTQLNNRLVQRIALL